MFDCIVVGAGHAGVEASISLAKAGKKTAVKLIMCSLIFLMPLILKQTKSSGQKILKMILTKSDGTKVIPTNY